MSNIYLDKMYQNDIGAFEKSVETFQHDFKNQEIASKRTKMMPSRWQIM